KQPKSAAHRGLAVLKGVPGKAHSRLEHADGTVDEKGATQVGSGIRDVDQVGELVLSLRRNRHYLVAYPKVQRHVRASPPIVLEVCAEESLAITPWRDRTGNA